MRIAGVGLPGASPRCSSRATRRQVRSRPPPRGLQGSRCIGSDWRRALPGTRCAPGEHQVSCASWVRDAFVLRGVVCRTHVGAAGLRGPLAEHGRAAEAVERLRRSQLSRSERSWSCLARIASTASSPSARRRGAWDAAIASRMAEAALSGSPGCVPSIRSTAARVTPAVGAESSMIVLVRCIRFAPNSVRNAPGSTMSTRMPSGATSAASASDIASSANFAEQ
jgi:hypothetical protein